MVRQLVRSKDSNLVALIASWTLFAFSTSHWCLGSGFFQPRHLPTHGMWRWIRQALGAAEQYERSGWFRLSGFLPISGCLGLWWSSCRNSHSGNVSLLFGPFTSSWSGGLTSSPALGVPALVEWEWMEPADPHSFPGSGFQGSRALQKVLTDRHEAYASGLEWFLWTGLWTSKIQFI